jgi:hypothetical protein
MRNAIAPSDSILRAGASDVPPHMFLDAAKLGRGLNGMGVQRGSLG